MLISDIPLYFDGVETKEGMSEDAEFHFKAKLSFLKNRKKADRHWRAIYYFLGLNSIELKDKRVLDIGCGTGYTSIYFAAAGAKEVVGIDLRESKIGAFKAFLSFLPEDIKSRIKAIRSNIINMKYTDYFDLVFAQEAISHIVDEGLFSRLFQMLRKNGALYITDDNNILCRKYRDIIYTYWDRVENGPPGPVAGCHTDVGAVYTDLRRELITKWFGDKLRDDAIDMLSKNTTYLYGEGLRKTCEEYILDGIVPDQKYVYGTCPIQPEHGYYIEKLINPYQLKKELLDTGFRKCSLYGSAGFSRARVVQHFLRFLPLCIKYRLGKFFAVIAIK